MLVMIFLAGCDSTSVSDPELIEVNQAASGSEIIQSAPIGIFQPAGDFGGGVLDPGAFFPPTDGGRSLLRRSADKIQYTLETTGLPAGAYTNWMVTINEPENCLTSPCTDVDVFGRTQEVGATVFWAAGAVVGHDGIGRFRATIGIGEIPGGDDQVGLPGPGLQNPYGGEFHIIVKYHGPASSNPDVLYEQLSTLTGSCEENANAYDLTAIGFGIQCFDPQVSIHSPE